MQRLRSSRSRPELATRSRSAQGARAVHLQYIDPVEATRDAHIAASKAFVLSQERCSSDISSAMFPDPLSGPLARTPHCGYFDGGTGHSAEASHFRSIELAPRRSIRFVQQGGPSANDAQLRANHFDPQSTPVPHEASLVDPATSEIRIALRRSVASESNYSRYTSSVLSTPTHKQNINKTWSGSQLRNKENLKAATTANRARNTIHIRTTPRRKVVSQRQWPRAPARSGVRGTSAIISAPASDSMPKAEDSSDTRAHPSGQTAYFPGANTNSDEASVCDHLPPAFRIRRLPPLAVPPMENVCGSECRQKSGADFFQHPLYETTSEMSTIPSSSVSRSKIFLRPHRRRSFSFSSNDDEKFTVVTSNITAAHTRHSLCSQRKENKGMKKSLRQSHPQPPRASVLPKHEADVNAVEAEVDGGNNIGGTGSLRRTASRMSKAVRSKLKTFWSHSKSESNSEKLPEQHVEAYKPHESFADGTEFMAEREGRLSISHGFHTGTECNDTGTVVRGGDEAGEILHSDLSGDTSRFTSWSSSVRRSPSNASYHPPMDEFEPQQLSVISESSDQLMSHSTPDRLSISTPGISSGFGAAANPSGYKIDSGATWLTRRLSHPQFTHLTTQQTTNKAAKSLAPGIVLKRPDHLEQATQRSNSLASSSSTSSPSLASSGRGDTPRQGIAPDALRRLQELSLDLKNVCLGADAARESAGRLQAKNAYAGDDDPFYNGKKEDTRFAFQSAPTTPREANPSAIVMSTETGKAHNTISPQYFFRGTSPFRRALRESMKSFEEQTATSRAQHRNRTGGSGDLCDRDVVGHGYGNGEEAEGNDDDTPLLHPDGARQWSRVQAWQANLVHDSSTKSDSNCSPHGKSTQALPKPSRSSSDFRTMISEGLCASTPSLGDGTGRTPVAQPVHLEHLHRDTVVSPEQLRLWMNRSVEMEMDHPVDDTLSYQNAVQGHMHNQAELDGGETESQL